MKTTRCAACGGSGERFGCSEAYCGACDGLGYYEALPRWPWLQPELGATLLDLVDATKCERCGAHAVVTIEGVATCWACPSQDSRAYRDSRLFHLVTAPRARRSVRI